MNLVFKELTIKNFLSFGNVPQTIKLNDKNFQIITGQNKDKSDNEEDKNGVGKSTIQQAIHYALFGKSTGNTVNLGYLVNNINGKNMLVSLKFEKDTVDYEIIRGRSPNVLQLLKNGESIIKDESQGDSRETQKEIEKILGFGDDLFNQLFNLTCQVELFLKQNTSNQKAILEKILGVDVISKKIGFLKDLIKETKNNLNNELFKYNTIKAQNENLTNTINKQISDMNSAKEQWAKTIKDNICSIKTTLNQLNQIDIDKEIENFKLLESYNKLEGVNALNKQLKDSLARDIENNNRNILKYQSIIDKYTNVSFDEERAKHQYNQSIMNDALKYQQELMKNDNDKRLKKSLEDSFAKISQQISQKELEITSLKESVCPTCGHTLNEKEFIKIKEDKCSELKALKEELHKVDMEIIEINDVISQFVPKSFDKKTTIFASEYETNLAENEYINSLKMIQEEQSKKNENTAKYEAIVIETIPDKPITHYSTMDEIMNHKVMVQSLETNLHQYEETLNTNPFEQQEKSIEDLKQNIIALDDSSIKSLETDLEHQETLLKLLNNPSSFIRKTILDKSLEFLNNRVAKYLEKIGSMHSVVFNNDMTIDFYKMGIKYGYISSGEEGRVSMALTFAFRDVWESLNNCNVNLLFFDEVIDRLGLDEAGIDLLIEMIKNMKSKNTMVVTHNSKLIGQTSNILKLVKENDFTTIL